MKVIIKINGNSDEMSLEEILQKIGEIQEKNHHIKEINVVVQMG